MAAQRSNLSSFSSRKRLQEIGQALVRADKIGQCDAIQHREKRFKSLAERVLQDTSWLNGAGFGSPEAGCDLQV